MESHESLFHPWYAWHSGDGSSEEYTAQYREFLSAFIKEKQIKSVVDLGCGDMRVMSNVDLSGASFIGVDCIEVRTNHNRELHPHLTFVHSDLRTFEIPDGTDLITCKDVLQHWSTQEIVDWLAVLKNLKFKYALITNDSTVSKNVNLPDIKTSGCRSIDLTESPFCIGKVVFHWHSKDVVLIENVQEA